MLKQLVLDMENQLLQVKTQVAMAIADQHLLQKKTEEHEGKAEDWSRKAALAVSRDRDDMAKQALSRSLTETRSAEAFKEQLSDQRAQADLLRTSYHKLQQKLEDTKARCEVLRATHRRVKVIGKAQKATMPLSQSAVDLYQERVMQQSAVNHAHQALTTPDVSDSFAEMERDEQVNALLDQLKNRRALSA